MEDYMKVSEASNKWRIAEKTIVIWCKNGLIRGAINNDGEYIIPVTARKPVALADSNYLIRDLDAITAILRNIYLYGCFGKGDFINGIAAEFYSDSKSRTIEKEQSRLQQYLPEDFLKTRKKQREKVLYCGYDMINNAENYITEPYRNKSFTMLDVISYFWVQSILQEKGKLQLGDILDLLPSDFSADTVFSKDNLRVQLEELKDKGVIGSRKEGKNVFYYLEKDIWENFSIEELKDLLRYSEFMKRVSGLEMPFDFLCNKLKHYLAINRQCTGFEKSPFRYKFNQIHNVLDNEVLLKLLIAINKNEVVKIKDLKGTNLPLIARPLRIFHDVATGRQYVLVYAPGTISLDGEYHKAFHPYKVKRLEKIRIDTKFDENEEKLFDLLMADQDGKYENEMFKDCWSISGFEKENVELVARFFFDEQKESYILRRIKREGHNGSINKIEEGVFEYKVLIKKDDKEIVPWIRSFGEKVKVISSVGFTDPLENQFANDWKEALQKYEAL